MLSSDKCAFLQVLCDFIHREKSVASDIINLEEIRNYAKKHEVLGIFYYQTKLPMFMSAYSSTIYINTNREKILDTVMIRINVPFIIVKGIEIAKYYPVPALRTMGDIDIVVHTCDREFVNNVFIEQGFKILGRLQDREWQYSKNGMEFELHDRLMYTETVNNTKQEEFFNDFWRYVNNNTLDSSFHFLFLISHLRKHFMNEGVGFRQFMDIAIMAQNATLDWEWIEKTAKEIELLPFLKTVLAFCTRWFKIVVPMEINLIEDPFYEAATNKIFEDGVFGFDNEENNWSAVANEFRKNGRLGLIRKAIRTVFPSYQNLRTVPKYSFIDGKPYLLPVGWIYRFFVGKKREKHFRKMINDSFFSTEQVTEREKMYRQWGL